MYQRVADRTLRSYRLNLKRGKSFTMELKTSDGVVEVFVDARGYATMRNSESGKFDLSVGMGKSVVGLVANHKRLPTPRAFGFLTSLPSAFSPALKQVIEQEETEAANQMPESIADDGSVALVYDFSDAPELAGLAQEPAGQRRRVDTRDIPNARKVIEAVLSGATHLRANNETLKALPDKKREWRYVYRDLVDGHWKVTVNEVVAVFEPNGDFVCPYSEQPAVLRRREMLKEAANTKRGDTT